MRANHGLEQLLAKAVCDLLGPAGETSVFVPVRATDRSSVSVRLMHNKLARTLSIEERDRTAASLAAVGIQLLSVEHTHGKFMTWDDDALLITSFNWLATSLDLWKPRGAEIGIVVKGAGLVEHLQTKFRQLAGIAPSTNADQGSVAALTNGGAPSSTLSI
jgi:phosphatidylserine/phosphatidylglycerophosphate/cardiolipin synthase-like enzyme